MVQSVGQETDRFIAYYFNILRQYMPRPWGNVFHGDRLDDIIKAEARAKEFGMPGDDLKQAKDFVNELVSLYATHSDDYGFTKILYPVNEIRGRLMECGYDPNPELTAFEAAIAECMANNSSPGAKILRMMDINVGGVQPFIFGTPTIIHDYRNNPSPKGIIHYAAAMLIMETVSKSVTDFVQLPAD